MTILIAVIAFFSGAACVAVLMMKWWKVEMDFRRHDPLQSPPNQHVAKLVESVMRQVREWENINYQFDESSPDSIRQALRWLLVDNGVMSIRDGVTTLPNGGTVLFGELALYIEDSLIAAYKSLDEASSIILDYAESLPKNDLRFTDNTVLRSISGQTAKFPFESDIRRLSMLLALDPEENYVALVGAKELCRRNRERQERQFGSLQII